MGPQASRLDANELARGLCQFVRMSPTAFQAVESIRARLNEAGFAYLPETGAWDVERGGSYYTVRNGSSIVAWRVGTRLSDVSFRIAASHSDSPMLKVKAQGELDGPGPYLRLNVETYGGMIDRTWLDRPLSLAGRAMVREGSAICVRPVYFDRDLLVVPSVAVHLNRKVNAEGAMDRRVDLMPLFSAGELKEGALDALVAQELGVDPDQVLSRDLFVVNRQEPVVWGAASEFVSGPRLDDLQCAYGSLHGFLDACAPSEDSVCVYACFDNEEVGSGSLQGALSTLLADVLARVCASLGMATQERERAIARSFLVSCDNAHAVHPNHPELYDQTNRSYINGGVVVKEAANQRYATDAMSRALFEELCRGANVPVQRFANRSDMLGGSTLGNLALRHVSMHAVDVGLPQLAMHSAYETAGTQDTAYLARAIAALFERDFRIEDDGSVRL